MNLADKPIFTAALTGVGSVAGGVAFHQSIATAAAGAAAGLGLLAAFNLLPGEVHFAHVELPQVRRFGWQPTILSPDAARMFDTMEKDLCASPLPSRERVRTALDDLQIKAKRFGKKAEVLNSGLASLRSDYDVPLVVAIEGIPAPSDLTVLHDFPNDLSVCCSIVEPAVLAALLDMKARLGVPLSVDFESMNGVAQVAEANERVSVGKPFDVMIVPNAPFLSSNKRLSQPAISTLYEFLLPVHREHQHVLRAKPRNKGAVDGFCGVEKIHFLEHSSCEEQYLGLKKEVSQQIKAVQWGMSDLPRLLEGMDGNEAAILYDPAATRLIKAGLAVSVPGRSYDLWVSMFLLRDVMGRPKFASALINAFVASWVYCRQNRKYAWSLLTSDQKFLTAFRKALLMDPV